MPDNPSIPALNPSRWADLTAPDTPADPRRTTTPEPVTKDMFLKLIVAQIRHQNPMNPIDGVDFLTQLSQITGVEQMVTMRQHLESIEAILRGSPAATTPTT